MTFLFRRSRTSLSATWVPSHEKTSGLGRESCWGTLWNSLWKPPTICNTQASPVIDAQMCRNHCSLPPTSSRKKGIGLTGGSTWCVVGSSGVASPPAPSLGVKTSEFLLVLPLHGAFDLELVGLLLLYGPLEERPLPFPALPKMC